VKTLSNSGIGVSVGFATEVTIKLCRSCLPYSLLRFFLETCPRMFSIAFSFPPLFE